MMIFDIGSKYLPSVFPSLNLPMMAINYSGLLFATLYLIFLGKPFIYGVGRFLRHGTASMDTLVGIGTSIAYLYSALVLLFPSFGRLINAPEGLYFDVTIVVIGFITLGKYLEANAKRRTGDASEKILKELGL
jgi:Cu2+-exporting ATPase/Cu+-exporting ATPase